MFSRKKIAGFAFVIGLIVLVAVAVWARRNFLITPESGVGYALGIAGATALLALFTYPLRKRVAWLKESGRMSGWFRLHMALGLLAPALILAHSGLRLGSVNGQVALFSMLVVAASGVVGRFIYRQIHRGLYGRLRGLREVRDEARRANHFLAALSGFAPWVLEEATALEKHLLDAPASRDPWQVLRQTRELRQWSRTTRQRLAVSFEETRRTARKPAERKAVDDAVNRHLSPYVSTLRGAIQFRLFERWFALWHVLHVPLVFLLVLATVFHVIAVHNY
ncbi:MAG: hypothetical protein LJE84_02270 [Gammaproteobacteria bacterium]|nr:hypothetical protein [Gammaproteobacteria bacterium]